jgi:hypothetical protein
MKDLFSDIEEELDAVEEVLAQEDEWNNIDWEAIPPEPNEKKKGDKNTIKNNK